MKIDKMFTKEQIKLLEKVNININKEYNKELLENLEYEVYNIMMDKLDEKQDFTPLAEDYEKILDIIVKIENEL